MVTLDLTKRVLTFAGQHVYQISSSLIQHLPQPQISKVLQTSSSGEVDSPASTEYLVRNWCDALFTWFQIVVLWHDPFVSICTLSGLFSTFLLLIYFAPRFYSTIMIAIFVYNLTKVWFRHVWPEIRVAPEEGREEELRLDVDRWTHLHPHLLTLTELHQIVENLMKSSENHLQNLLALRREKPVAFCLIICSTLSCTAYIGNRISDTTILMSAISALVLAPGIYLYLLPKAAQVYLKQCFGKTFQNNAQTQLQEETTMITQTSPESLPPTSSSPQPSSSMLTLFEQLKSNSFIARQLQNIETTFSVATMKENYPLLVSELRSSAIEVPTGDINQEAQIKQRIKDHQTIEEKKDSDESCISDLERENQTSSSTKAAPRRSSDDLSSNESTSLIDLDDDQQDGFVML